MQEDKISKERQERFWEACGFVKDIDEGKF